MGAISGAAGFRNHSAVQQKQRNPNEERMEQAVIACDRKDAAAVRAALHNFVGWLTKPQNQSLDELQSAILACRRRDRAIISNLLKGH